MPPEFEIPVAPRWVYESHDERGDGTEERGDGNEPADWNAVDEDANAEVDQDAHGEVREEIEGCGKGRMVLDFLETGERLVDLFLEFDNDDLL